MNNRSDSELLLFYNTENFFPPDEAPIHKTDPTNSGLQNWDERKYIHKLNRIARVFQLVEETEGILPMIIGLAEIQGDKVLQDLVNLPPFNNTYKFIHYESLDERGVDVALLYNPEKIEILHSEPISYLFEMENGNDSYIDTTRDVLYCKVKYQNEILNLFVAHFPSKREKDVNKPKRDFILNDIKKKISSLIKDENQAVFVLGDFNDNPTEENIIEFTQDEFKKPLLRNEFISLYENKIYSTFHINEGLLFDQILFSFHFVDHTQKLQFDYAKVFNSDALRYDQDPSNKKPFRTYAGRRYLGGYSDHFPVYIKLKKSNYEI